MAANDNSSKAVETARSIRPLVQTLMDASAGETQLIFGWRQEANRGWSILMHSGSLVATKNHVQHLGSLRFYRGALLSNGSTVRRDGSVRFNIPSERHRFSSNSEAVRENHRPIMDHVAGEYQRNAEGEFARHADQEVVRSALGHDAVILDLAIGDATAKEIGEALGYSGKTAERRGMQAIDLALKKFEKLAA